MRERTTLRVLVCSMVSTFVRPLVTEKCWADMVTIHHRQDMRQRAKALEEEWTNLPPSERTTVAWLDFLTRYQKMLDELTAAKLIDGNKILEVPVLQTQPQPMQQPTPQPQPTVLVKVPLNELREADATGALTGALEAVKFNAAEVFRTLEAELMVHGTAPAPGQLKHLQLKDLPVECLNMWDASPGALGGVVLKAFTDFLDPTTTFFHSTPSQKYNWTQLIQGSVFGIWNSPAILTRLQQLGRIAAGVQQPSE